MSLPKIPDINPNISLKREDSINMLIASVALEEIAMAHILNAEGEKIQYILGTLEGGKDPGEITVCDVMKVNKSVNKTLMNAIATEMLLLFKLEDVIELSGEECEGEN